LALDNCLQVQQCLQSCLFTSIKWILCKLRLFRNNKLLDIIFQLVYAYGCWLGAIDIPPRRRLVSSITPNWRSRLCCCTRRNWVGSLHANTLAIRAVDLILSQFTYADGRMAWIRLLGIRRHCAQLLVAIGTRIGGLPLRRWGVGSASWWRWCVPAGNWLSTSKQLLLTLITVLIGSHGCIPGGDQGILDRANLFNRKDGLCRQRSWNGLFPCLEHLIHLAASSIINFSVGTHKDRVKFGPEVQSIRGGDILDYRIQHIQCRQGSRWWCLGRSQLVFFITLEIARL